MTSSGKFEHFYMHGDWPNIDDSKKSDFGYFPKILISAILIIEIICIVQFWPS